MIEVLCWAAFLRTLTQSIPQLFHAAGRPELAAYDSLFTLPCFVGFGWVLVRAFGSTLGANAVSFAWMATYLCTLSVLFLMVRGIMPVKLREFLGCLGGPLSLMGVLWGAARVQHALYVRFLPSAFATALGLGLSLLVALAYVRFVLKIRVGRRSPARRDDGDSSPP
ncbi:MAG TPA: hypothetical protein VFQ35_07860, partial [Polyangiaceae bacterium]|nr:hypothetical protein [Polyangiaceae bacterium]